VTEIIEYNLKNPKLVRYAFGWSHKSWSRPLKDSSFRFPKRLERILEIGASKHSLVALIFDGYADEIVVSYYEETQRQDIEDYLSVIRQKYNLKSKYTIKKVDANTVVGNFDVVIMKSVLGGLFRENSSSISDVQNFVSDLLARTVNYGGILIAIDNGKSFYESYISQFGARKNQWRFFKSSDLGVATEQSKFGLFSGFSFETRLGFLGSFLDNYIIYPIDLMLFKFWHHNPTVIVSAFNNCEKSQHRQNT
jgi:hypothetical protein